MLKSAYLTLTREVYVTGISYVNVQERLRRGMTSQGAQHSTRSPLVLWYGTVVSQRSVLAEHLHTEYKTKMSEYKNIMSSCNTAINRVCDTRIQSVVLTCSQFIDTLGGHPSMVSTWRMTRSLCAWRLSYRSSLRKLEFVPVGFLNAPAVQQYLLCATTTGHQTAHVPSRVQERVPIAWYVCSPHGMHSLCLVLLSWLASKP